MGLIKPLIMQTQEAPDAEPEYNLDNIRYFVGRELGVSEWVTVEQSAISQFAECTGDHQWIHVDVERCRAESPFGAPIAHGFLTLSMVPALQMRMGMMPPGAARAINCGVNEVRFQSPVLAGERVRLRVVLQSVDGKGKTRLIAVTRNILEVEGKEKPALTADMVAMFYRS